MLRSLPIFALLLFAPHLQADDAANAALQQGKVQDAERTLHASLSANAHDALAHQLLCRVYFAQELMDQAVTECEAAAAAVPSDSPTQMWLGRGYGRKAAHANPLAAYGLARKARVAFERAVQLDPGNGPAASDLGEFYVAAPSMVGGGHDKARHLAESIRGRFPARSHRIVAYLAESDKDLVTAESEFKQAIDVGHVPDAYMDLAQFYARHGESDQAVAAVHAGVAADPSHGPALVDAASILTDLHRSPDFAEQALRLYVASPAASEAAPVFKAHLQLGKLLARRGDAAGAPSGVCHRPRTSRREFIPAQKAARGA